MILTSQRIKGERLTSADKVEAIVFRRNHSSLLVVFLFACGQALNHSPRMIHTHAKRDIDRLHSRQEANACVALAIGGLL